MIGFHDHVINRSSGRPEPHSSWPAERFITWTGWITATVSLAGGAYYWEKWGDLGGAMPMLGSAPLFALIAYARQKALERKKRAFRKALLAYEAVLARHPAPPLDD